MLGIHTITFDSAEPYELGKWWSGLTGWPVASYEPGDEEVLLEAPDGHPDLLFIKVPEGKGVKNRVHLDLWPADGATRDEEVQRVLGLGAEPHGDFRRPDGTGWMTLLDPEGNEFCIVRSQAERV
ncbi:glyoxalase [Microtetraspora sp. NBRC 13810]|uniref:VOC family protein n=1 Tax=Microtetraspora sp. NBRC 13810 TaxID=3030990 RepID=UPI0024A32A06|nr:VOC family protein [Microtetraspora sp. NBRC 13810]GLW12614.1 glyoxalase [Microtetraspora sp. NBRC 13810]